MKNEITDNLWIILTAIGAVIPAVLAMGMFIKKQLINSLRSVWIEDIKELNNPQNVVIEKLSKQIETLVSEMHNNNYVSTPTCKMVKQELTSLIKEEISELKATIDRYQESLLTTQLEQSEQKAVLRNLEKEVDRLRDA